MDGREVLNTLGITNKAVRGAIEGLINSSPELKAQVREIVGSDESEQFEEVGSINGERVYARREN